MLATLEIEGKSLKADPSGVIRVGGTRVSLESVVLAFRDGCSAEEVAMRYPSLHLADVYGVIAAYLRHQEEVDGYVDARVEAAASARSRIESEMALGGLRERLLARGRERMAA